jgi:drug/metabolite transporter, DME family
MRLAVGGFALLSLAIARGSLRSGIEWPKLVTFLSAASMAAYQPFFFTGVKMTGVAVGIVVAIGNAPVLAGLLSLLARKEYPEKRWYLATLLAISGCALLFSPGGDIRLAPLGIFFSLCAGLAYAAYAVTSKELLDRHPVDTVVAVVFSRSKLGLRCAAGDCFLIGWPGGGEVLALITRYTSCALTEAQLRRPEE